MTAHTTPKNHRTMLRKTLLSLATAAPFLLAAQPHTADHIRLREPMPSTLLAEHPGRPDAVTRGLRSGGAVLWSEDFETGMNGWTVQTPSGPVEWELTTTGNTGGFTPGPLQSSTGFPGGQWIVADSDLNGVPNVLENSTITSPPITGLDTIPHMLLRFEQSFRQLNNDETLVEVSGDGGQTWTMFPVNTEVAGNQSTPGAPLAETIELDISAALDGGASDIRIRFHWLSVQGYAYSWQVDDVALVAALENDLRLEHVSHAQWDVGQGNFAQLPYTIYPTNEVRELSFQGVVSNIGSTTQTNVRLVVDVDGPSTNNVTLTSSAITLMPGETESLTITGYTIPAVNGDYDVTYTVTQDQVEGSPADNARNSSFAVAMHTFARDHGALEGDMDNAGAEYQLGNWFHVVDWQNTLYAVDVALSERSDPGAIIVATVYDEDLDYIIESEEHIVQASELNDLGEGNFITLPLIDPVPLDQDKDYFVAVHHYGGTADTWTGVSGTSQPQTSLFWDASDNTWYYVTVTPMVRMNLDATVGLQEQDAFGADGPVARPTAFDEGSLITFTLDRPTDVAWRLLDMTGRTVQQGHLGTRPAGPQQFHLGGAGLGQGAYLLHLDTGSGHRTVRLVKTAQ